MEQLHKDEALGLKQERAAALEIKHVLPHGMDEAKLERFRNQMHVLRLQQQRHAELRSA
jgi:hypothetical protein